MQLKYTLIHKPQRAPDHRPLIFLHALLHVIDSSQSQLKMEILCQCYPCMLSAVCCLYSWFSSHDLTVSPELVLLICLLNQTTKSVDSTTSEERQSNGYYQNFPEFNEPKCHVLNPSLRRFNEDLSFLFFSRIPRHESINSS